MTAKDGAAELRRFASRLAARHGLDLVVEVADDDRPAQAWLPADAKPGVRPASISFASPPWGDAVAAPPWDRSLLLVRTGGPGSGSAQLGAMLRDLRDRAPVGIIAAHRGAGPGARDDAGRDGQVGRDRAGDALRALLLAHGVEAAFVGTLPAAGDTAFTVGIVDRGLPPHREPPGDFTVVAFMAAYNEADIIVPSVEGLVSQGIKVHLIDNWSTDGTADRIAHLVESGAVVVERFPAAGPSAVYDWTGILGRVEQLASDASESWCVLHDVDERRGGPWPGVDLRTALYTVDRAGFDAIDHTVLQFQPVDDGYPPGTDFSSYFRHFEFGSVAANRVQVKAWKNRCVPVSIVASGGHDARFEGRRVFPYNFLLRHYPIRSQTHGERKVFRERRPRWSPDELTRGWHYQYKDVRRRHAFIRPAASLTVFDESFPARFLAKRLLGVDAAPPEPTRGQRLRRRAFATLRRAGLLPAYTRARSALRRFVQ